MHDADTLVGRAVDELERTFRTQRADLEHSLDNDSASTEDPRMAFGPYRGFFDRLLSL